MGNLEQRIAIFVRLGEFFRQFSNKYSDTPLKSTLKYEPFEEKLMQTIQIAEAHNGWFTRENVLHALSNWGALLTREKLEQWLGAYKIPSGAGKTIAIITAGNIPLVGFHDLLSVLITGHKAIVKQSSSDRHLLPFIAAYLENISPLFKDKVLFTEDTLSGFDAVIATGSNNTSRYFEYYFGKKPNIIRKNRNSVAVLTGKETPEQLQGLGEDIFRYFGLGCRSVSKIFIPEGYDFDPFFNAMYSFKDILDIQKYANNYDYNKAVYLMSLFEIKDNGFLILRENMAYASPIGTVFYEYYPSENILQKKLTDDAHKLQCIVSEGFIENEVLFGKTQRPALHEYADGVDTVDFLLKI
ncbi:acyl-CoA reductase [Ascidiimonas aurantiaca]|uniref:acyl-CoA reductase n=1 Tax=Ascidiimonas aurantiaca TaxID=1685432 RepID=UPI0030EB48C5